MGWVPVPGELIVVAHKGNHTWGVNKYHTIFQYNHNTNQWTSIPGQLKHIDVGEDGDVWGVNASDTIFHWNGSGWDNIPGQLKQISVGNRSNIWGVNSADTIFRWTGNSWQCVDGKLKHVSVGPNGDVWGVNSSDTIFHWTGSSWTPIEGQLKQISVGANGEVWGVNSSDTIFKRVGNAWQPVEGKLCHISAHSAGHVWGVNSAGTVFRLDPNAQPISPQPTYGQPNYPQSPQPTYGQPNYPQSPQPTYGQPTYVQPTYGQPTYGQPTYGQPTYVQPPQQSQLWGQRVPWYSIYYDSCGPQLIQQITSWFYSIDTDRNGHLDYNEVGKALQQAQLYFQPDTVQRIIRVFDLDKSGTIALNEFICLYQYVCQVRSSFATCDRDRDGYLDWSEIPQAIQGTGMSVSQQSLAGLNTRFDPSRSGKINMETFTNLSLHIASLRSFFDNIQYSQPEKDSKIRLSFDEVVGASPFYF